MWIQETMMTTDLSNLLLEIAGETLEQLAFIFSFPDDLDPEAIWTGASTACRVTFSGPTQGEVLLVISSAALPELTANMLGLDDDETPPEDQQQDALCEALNVICGNLLPRIGGVEAVFDIQAPAIIDAESARARATEFNAQSDGCARALLSLDDGECQLYLHMNDAA